jgi:hypothetical protein
MNKREQAKKRMELLKGLRAEHGDSVAKTKALLKEQKKVFKSICQCLNEEPKTVPEVAESTGMPTHQVLWYMTAYKKYDIVVEDSMCGDYVRYKRAQEKN